MKRHIGAKALNYEQTRVDADLRELSGGRDPDVSIEAVGMESRSPGPQYE
jgi:threonine dehydrogenase-like Zn-dependent dehydrogenase